MSRTIQAIPTASVAKICSGQVILDLSTAVKELVENALDAGATSVEIRLREHGLQLIEVADNGKGVPPEDYAALALKYHTSKISQFQDLEALHTFGFRGEALSSIAALGELSVITRTAEQTAATRLEFDRDGNLTRSTPVARAVGTTVAIKDLFAPLPVRRQEFMRNVRREVAKLKLLLQQYAIMSTQAQLFASDQAGKAARTVLVSTLNAGSGLLQRVSAVLGSKVAAVLVPMELKLQEEGVTITGLVSRAGCGVKGEKLRQFCCINSRPVELPRAIKTLNDTYKSLYSSIVGLRPMAVLSFELPPGTFDINVTPDKRSVFVQREAAMVNALQQALQALWEPSRHSYAVNPTQTAFASQPRTQPATQAQAAAAPQEEGEAEDADEQHQQQYAASEPIGSQQDPDRHRNGESEGDEEEEAAAALGSSRTAVAVPGGPPSLASFMTAGHANAAAAPAAATAARQVAAQLQLQPGGAANANQQQHTDAAAAAAAAAAAGSAAAAAAAAAAGQKRLRSLEAALLGRKVPRQHGSGPGSSSAAAAGVAAADGSLDVGAADSDEQGGDDFDDDDYGAATAAGAGAAQQQQQQQRQRVPLPLASFQLGGSSQQLPAAMAATAVGQQSGGASPAAAAVAAAAGAGGSGVGKSRSRGASWGGGRDGTAGQAPLAAFGFRVLPADQQQRQRRWQVVSDGSDEEPGDIDSQSSSEEGDEGRGRDAAEGSEGFLETSEQATEQQQRQRQQLGPDDRLATHVNVVDMIEADEVDGGVGPDRETRGAGARQDGYKAGSQFMAGAGQQWDEDGDVVLIEQQQQQQQQQPGRGREEQRLPLAVDYSMQQLMADVELQMQQMKVQQQAGGDGAGGEAAGQHSNLSAASLRGDAAEGAAGAPAAAAAADGSAPAAAAAAAADGNAPAAADGSSGPDAATSELMRVFNKADFAEMQSVGQFNLGFIIAKLRGDLFIVDQHAADEKSTFERLMGSYTVNKQPLLQPRRLNTLTHMDQQTIREHMDIFKRNGFDFVEREVSAQAGGHRQGSDQQQRLWSKPPRSKAAAAAAAAAASETADASTHDPVQGGPVTDAAAAAAAGGAPVAADGAGGVHQQEQSAAEVIAGDILEDCGGSELLLSAVPVLKSGVSGGGALGEEVLLELLDLIAAGETRPEDIRPKKVRDVLASRACRTSIMIGSPLTRQQQGRILARLAQLDAPFNCPHGRPTMRHLAVLPEEPTQHAGPQEAVE